MNRLQKKCLFAASGVHLLLLVILIVGPAFLLSQNQADDTPVLTFIPSMTTDKAFAGGGNPTATPPPPAPVQQPAPPQPQPEVQPKPAPPPPAPEPQKVTPPEPVKNDPDSLEPAKPTKPKIQVNTKLVKRQDLKKTSKDSKTANDTSAADAKAEAERARAFKVAASQLREGLSSSTKVEMVGPGGGGPSYARYRDVVQKIYYDAWIEPNADGGIGSATIVIAKDGTVISARMVDSSGNPSVDRSIQETLDRVKFVAPFPEGATEEQRTYTIRFNLEAKKSLG